LQVAVVVVKMFRLVLAAVAVEQVVIAQAREHQAAVVAPKAQLR
jgi:hypothetical protein